MENGGDVRRDEGTDPYSGERDGTTLAGPMVGDFCYFENRGTGGGGAEAKVSMVVGEDVESSSSMLVATRLISHRQRLDLSFSSTGSFTFVPDTLITTFSEVNTSRAKARVVSYDSSTKVLIVQTITKDLIKYGDSFFDNRGRKVTMPVAPAIEADHRPMELIVLHSHHLLNPREG